MEIIEQVKSADDMAVKYLQKSKDGYLCETVLVDYYNKNIICYSCSLGCPIGCKMCYNGVYKNFIRNLTSAEIVSQIKNCVKYINPSKQILFSGMGVGEPLLNVENVTEAILKLNNENPNSKFAIATTVPNINNLEMFLEKLKSVEKLKIMISLHASNSVVRNKIIPLNAEVEELVKNCIDLSKKYKREFEFNYLLFEGINDDIQNAKELAKLIPNDYVIKINRFNHVEGVAYKPSQNSKQFVDTLKSLGKQVEEYSTNGEDINAACGQLSSNKKL